MKRFNDLLSSVRDEAIKSYDNVRVSLTDDVKVRARKIFVARFERKIEEAAETALVWIHGKTHSVHTCAEPVEETEESMTGGMLIEMIAKERKRISGLYAPKRSVANVLDVDVRKHYRAMIKTMKKEGRNRVRFSDLSVSDKWYRVSIVPLAVVTAAIALYTAVCYPAFGMLMLFLSLFSVSVGVIDLPMVVVSSFGNVNLRKTVLSLTDLFARVAIVGLFIAAGAFAQPVTSFVGLCYVTGAVVSVLMVSATIGKAYTAAPEVVIAARSL